MLGAGSLWGPRQSLPASGWSGRRTCSCQLAWAEGGVSTSAVPPGSQALPCPGTEAHI